MKSLARIILNVRPITKCKEEETQRGNNLYITSSGCRQGGEKEEEKEGGGQSHVRRDARSVSPKGLKLTVVPYSFPPCFSVTFLAFGFFPLFPVCSPSFSTLFYFSSTFQGQTRASPRLIFSYFFPVFYLKLNVQ